MSVDPVSLSIEVAMIAASMAMTASQKIQGPRLDDLDVSLADYGAPIPRLWGKRRINPQIIWAEKLREKKTTNKTKGGKYQDHKYFGTFAALICDVEIEAVTRIWMDKRLVYQRSGTGPVSAAVLAVEAIGPLIGRPELKLAFGRNMRIYLGTETQEPDPRIEAWCEDRYGPDSCPAYRGCAYLVFEELPLEKFGNRIPQLTVEVVRKKSDALIAESRATSTVFSGFSFSSDYSRFIVGNNDGTDFEFWDTANRQILSAGDLPLGMAIAPGWPMGLDNEGTIWGLYTDGAFVEHFRSVHGDGFRAGVDVPIVGVSSVLGVQCVDNVVYGLPFLQHKLVKPGYDATDLALCPQQYIKDPDGNHWAIGGSFGTPDFGLQCVLGARIGEAAVFTHSAAAFGQIGAVHNGTDFVIQVNDTLYKVDNDTLAILDSNVPAGISGADLTSWRALPVGALSLWIGLNQYSLETLDYIDTVSPGAFTPSVPAIDRVVYDPVNHALMGKPSGADTTRYYLYRDRVVAAATNLAEVVDEVASWCGLEDADTAALTQELDGYSVTQGTGKDMLQPLLDIHDVDARPHDFTIQFVNRGSSPTGTILTGDFVREDDSARYTVTIQQDTDLPRKITYNFADTGKDQQTNNVFAQRPLDATDSVREESIDLTTYADTPDSAQRKADRYFRRLWNSRERTNNALTAQHLGLEPGDVTTISLDGIPRTVRLDKLTVSGPVLACEFVRDDPSVAVLNDASGPEMEGRDPEVIYVPALSRGFALDIPLIQDSDSEANPLIYVGAGPYGGSWPGAALWRGDDGTYDDLFASFPSSAATTWGYAVDALPPANPNLWDRGSTITVNLFSGELTSATEAEIDADPTLNLAAIGTADGWELVQFTTATLTGTSGSASSYEVSGFKRGRRGTEWAIGLHAAGSTFLLVSTLLPQELGLDDVGNGVSFKAQTYLRPIESGVAESLTFAGASLKPYAPACLKGRKDPASGDWVFTWDRRTRIGGNWNGAAIPLGEASEAYELVILDGTDEVRSITASSKTATWTAAEQTADFGSGQASASIALYQISATVGRGFAATAAF